MLRELSTKNLLQQWIDAAEQFCTSKTPNYRRLAALTWRTKFEFTIRDHDVMRKILVSELQTAHDMAECLVKTRRRYSRDDLDRALLRSSRFVEHVGATVMDLADWAVEEGLLSIQAAEQLDLRVDQTVRQRKKTLERRRLIKPVR